MTGILRTKLITGHYPWDLPKDHDNYAPRGGKAPEQPSPEQLTEWMQDGGCMTVDDCCWVETDGECVHGSKSWLVELGLI
jgi:hypothetical protein